MKKLFISLSLSAIILTTSCATVLGGPVTEEQRTKPQDGEPSRKVRAGYLIADIFLTGGLGVIIDFVTTAIYKPEKKESN